VLDVRKKIEHDVFPNAGNIINKILLLAPQILLTPSILCSRLFLLWDREMEEKIVALWVFHLTLMLALKVS
jgi:hypothetical protein